MTEQQLLLREIVHCEGLVLEMKKFPKNQTRVIEMYEGMIVTLRRYVTR